MSGTLLRTCSQTPDAHNTQLDKHCLGIPPFNKLCATLPRHHRTTGRTPSAQQRTDRTQTTNQTRAEHRSPTTKHGSSCTGAFGHLSQMQWMPPPQRRQRAGVLRRAKPPRRLLPAAGHDLQCRSTSRRFARTGLELWDARLRLRRMETHPSTPGARHDLRGVLNSRPSLWRGKLPSMPLAHCARTAGQVALHIVGVFRSICDKHAFHGGCHGVTASGWQALHAMLSCAVWAGISAKPHVSRRGTAMRKHLPPPYAERSQSACHADLLLQPAR